MTGAALTLCPLSSSSLLSQSGIDVSKDSMAMQRLKEAAEKAKIELSSSLQVCDQDLVHFLLVFSVGILRVSRCLQCTRPCE